MMSISGSSDSNYSEFFKGERPSHEFEFAHAQPLHNHTYLLPGIISILGTPENRRLLDLGCGNGSLTVKLDEAGFRVTGAENSQSGIAIARDSFPQIPWFDQDIDDHLDRSLGTDFDIMLAAEVIEHLFLPRHLFERANEALRPGGALVLTTPFHGYWKNLGLAVTNQFDHHWRPSWDYGHIKFFSKETLGSLCREMGFTPRKWTMVGRVPALAKSMILLATKDQ